MDLLIGVFLEDLPYELVKLLFSLFPRSGCGLDWYFMLCLATFIILNKGKLINWIGITYNKYYWDRVSLLVIISKHRSHILLHFLPTHHCHSLAVCSLYSLHGPCGNQNRRAMNGEAGILLKENDDNNVPYCDGHTHYTTVCSTSSRQTTWT